MCLARFALCLRGLPLVELFFAAFPACINGAFRAIRLARCTPCPVSRSADGEPSDANLFTVLALVGLASAAHVTRWSLTGAHVASFCHRWTILEALTIESLVAFAAWLVAVNAGALLSRRALCRSLRLSTPVGSLPAAG